MVFYVNKSVYVNLNYKFEVLKLYFSELCNFISLEMLKEHNKIKLRILNIYCNLKKQT